MNTGLEKTYRAHHGGKHRGDDFAILKSERGSFLKNHIGTGKQVLDIGCRDGELTSTYYEGNTVFGVDIDKVALERAQEKLGIDIKQMDLHADWDLPESQYDVVVACELLEHVYFPKRIIKEVHKVLKEDGFLIGTIPHAYSLQGRIKFLLGIKSGTPLEDPTHINHFSHREFKKLLESEYREVVMDEIVPRKYTWLSKILPFYFAHDLLFIARK